MSRRDEKPSRVSGGLGSRTTTPMTPSIEDLKLRAKLPDYAAGEGYVSVPLSDWDAILWFLEMAEPTAARCVRAEEALRQADQALKNAETEETHGATASFAFVMRCVRSARAAIAAAVPEENEAVGGNTP